MIIERNKNPRSEVGRFALLSYPSAALPSTALRASKTGPLTFEAESEPFGLAAIACRLRQRTGMVAGRSGLLTIPFCRTTTGTASPGVTVDGNTTFT